MKQIFLLVVMLRIKPIIANHLKMFLRDMANQSGNKIQNGNSFNHELTILVAVVMKGNQRPIVRINTRGSNDRSAKITADIFDGMVSGTGMGFSSDIKAIAVIGINRSLNCFKRRTNHLFHFIEQSGTESVTK